MPPRTKPKAIKPWRPKKPIFIFGIKAPIIIIYTGQRAEHVINGAISIVVSLSFSCSMLLAAIIPGIAQAKLDRSGINARPFKPTLAISESTKNAARVI